MKIALEAGKEEDEYEKDESEDYDDYDDSESDRVEAEDINIEYLSSDDTPDYKTQTNNYSDDDEERISIGSTR
jgi:RNA polymerase sigma-54 factor